MEYELYQSKANNASKGLYYARAKYKGVLTLSDLAEHMARCHAEETFPNL